MNQPTILFDFDGTIADSFTLIVKILNVLSPRYHFKQLTPNRIKQFRETPLLRIVKNLGVSMIRLPFLVLNLSQRFNIRMREVKPYPDMLEILQILSKQGYQIGIVTYNSSQNVEIFLKQFNAGDAISFIYKASRWKGKHHKVAEVIDIHDLNPDQVVYIGDEEGDIYAARYNHIGSIAVSWGLHSHDFLEPFNPDFLVDRPQDLIKAIHQYFEKNL